MDGASPALAKAAKPSANQTKLCFKLIQTLKVYHRVNSNGEPATQKLGGSHHQVLGRPRNRNSFGTRQGMAEQTCQEGEALSEVFVSRFCAGYFRLIS